MSRKIKLGAYCDRDNIKGEKILETVGLRDVLSFETNTNLKLESIMWYPTWQPLNGHYDLPRKAIELVFSHNATPHLVWELCHPGANPCKDTIPLNDIISGKYDNYISGFAKFAKSFEKEIFIRFLHEFNGTWYGWSGIKNKKNPKLISETWKHVVSIFKNENSSNVKWVWSPNAICGGTPDSNSWNHIKNYWPGEDYVDYIGLDGYNFYPFMEVPQPLLSFEQIFGEIYDQCTELASPKIKFMIAETATGEYSAEHQKIPNKASWILDTIQSISSPRFERIEWFFWFNVKKELDWRVESSPSSLEAFKTLKQIIA